MTKQCRMILKHMQEHPGISQKQAADLYGIQRLGARIYDLKKLGYPIDGRPRPALTGTAIKHTGQSIIWHE